MKTLQISKEEATEWYKSENQTLQQLALKMYPELLKRDLPKSWEELKEVKGFYVTSHSKIAECYNGHKAYNINENIFKTKEQAEASIAMAQLSQLRELYRDGWQPDWTDYKDKWCIILDKDKMRVFPFWYSSAFLSFQDKETAELFLNNFKDLILKAKPLLS